MANSQAVLALTFDGICSLPAGLWPPRPLYLQWTAKTAQIEQTNQIFNRILAQVNSLYSEAGLHPVLLKGQGIGTNYRNPLHSQCGDIDIYLGKEGQPVANRLLLQQEAIAKGEASDKHSSYRLESVHIENHRLILRVNNPFANRRFQQLIREWYSQGAESGFTMPLPLATFNALYVFLHAFVHFLNSSIGLRQLCDWTYLLANRQEEIDETALRHQLQKMGLLQAAQSFGYIVVYDLGLPPGRLPIPIEGKKILGEKLLKEIFATGNFGQHDSRIKPRPQGYWTGKWYTFYRVTRRCIELRQFAPGEAFRYPVTLIKGTVAMQINRMRGAHR